MGLSVSPAALRILRALVSCDVLTKPALQELLGVSEATAFRAAGELIALGLIRQSEPSTRKRGRPATLLRLEPFGLTTIALTIEADTSYIAVVGAKGTVENLTEVPVSNQTNYRDAVTVLRDAILLARAQAATLSPILSGVGVAFGGSVNTATGELLEPSRFPGWHHRPLAHDLSVATGLICAVDNDITSLTRMIAWYSNRPCNDFLVLNCSRGIGIGICLDGKVRVGRGHVPAGLAHTQSPSADTVKCECGRYGCMEANHSLLALARHLKQEPGQRAASLIELAHTTPDGRQFLVRAGDALGQRICELARCLDISVIVATGELVEYSTLFRDALSSRVDQEASLPRADQRLRFLSEVTAHPHPQVLAAAAIGLDHLIERGQFFYAR